MASATTPDTILLSSQRATAASELQHCACGAKMCEPRLLDCLHVLGKCCVQPQNKDSKLVVVCTQCLHETPVPEAKLQLLPSPSFLFQLQTRQQRKQGKKPACEQCKTDPAEATVRCVDCAKLICQKHKDMHAEFDMMQGHTFSEVDNTAPAHSVCRRHKVVAETYCEDCKLVLCGFCKSDDTHKAHTCYKLEQMLQRLEPQIRTKLAALSLAPGTTGNAPAQRVDGGQGHMPDVRKALDSVEHHISVYLNQKEFFRARAEQILEAGTEEEKILLHRTLHVPEPSQLLIKCESIDAAVFYVPNLSKCPSIICLEKADSDVPKRDLEFCCKTNELTRDEWWRKVEVDSLIISKDRTCIWRVGGVDKIQRRCRCYFLNTNGCQVSGGREYGWTEEQWLSTYDLLVKDVYAPL